MKRVLLFAFALCCLFGAQAQNSPEVKARIAEIRKMYADVKETQEFLKQAELPPNETVITNDYMAPGAGPIVDTYHYYYSGDFSEEAGDVLYVPFFITRKYNVGARDYYEEILFDDDGSLAFFYEKTYLGECRIYFSKGEVIHIIKDEEADLMHGDDTELLLKYCNRLLSSFNMIMN